MTFSEILIQHHSMLEHLNERVEIENNCYSIELTFLQRPCKKANHESQNATDKCLCRQQNDRQRLGRECLFKVEKYLQ